MFTSPRVVDNDHTSITPLLLHQPKSETPRPKGLFPRLAAMRPFEGIRVEVQPDADRWAAALRAVGAIVTDKSPDLVIEGPEPPPHEWDDDECLEGVVGVGGTMLDLFVLSPWVR